MTCLLTLVTLKKNPHMLVIFSFHNICGAMKRNFSCELPQKRCKFNGRPTKVQRKQYIAF
jgi:hypothetical protein